MALRSPELEAAPHEAQRPEARRTSTAKGVSSLLMRVASGGVRDLAEVPQVAAHLAALLPPRLPRAAAAHGACGGELARPPSGLCDRRPEPVRGVGRQTESHPSSRYWRLAFTRGEKEEGIYCSLHKGYAVATKSSPLYGSQGTGAWKDRKRISQEEATAATSSEPSKKATAPALPPTCVRNGAGGCLAG